VFGLSGTLCSLIIRYELYYSGARIINSQNHNYYNLNITLHGLIMIFFLIMPILYGGFGNYIIPINNISLDIGFPRINNFSLLLLPISYLFIIISNFIEFGGGTGWTLYPPLSTSNIILSSLSINIILYGLLLSGISSLLSSINYIITILNCKNNIIIINLIDLFSWSILFTALMLILTLPILTGAILMLYFDINFNTIFFDGNLYLLLIIISFLGYVLPWGQLSYWGVTVITNILSIIPYLIEWICGNYIISTPTIKRFFIFHFILSFILLIFIFYHIFYLHNKGSNNPIGRNINYFIPFYIFIILKDLISLNILIIYIIIQNYFGILELSHPDNTILANGFITPYHIVPECYFLAFYCILKAITNKISGLIILLYFISVLFIFTDYKNYIFNYHLNISYNYIYSFLLLTWIGSKLPQEKFIIFQQLTLLMYYSFTFNYLSINLIYQDYIIPYFYRYK